MRELTMIFFKPDALEKNLMSSIMMRFYKEGLEVAQFKNAYMEDEQYDEHYGHIQGFDFYEDMRNFMTSCELMFVILIGENAIQKVRDMIGSTRNAPKGTIRGDYGSEGFRNLIHASDSYESVNKEIARFFYCGSNPIRPTKS